MDEIEELARYEDFRQEVRAWCKATVPPNWREQQRTADRDEVFRFQSWWRDQVSAAGYLVPHWPKAWGGTELSLAQQVILYEELARGDAPRQSLTQVALFNSAPAIIHAGTQEQKERFLPGMLRGEIWCQGFSEPNAGSDLASLQTRAVRDGDSYIVNGQKVWTSGARHAKWCILLARTDPDAPKTKGISFFVMDMQAPGVEVRPIKNIIGDSEFCETFLTDVVIPVENRIGAENDGWRVSQATLGSERAVVLVGLAELLRRNGRDFLIEQVSGWTMPDGSPAIEDRAVRQTLARLFGEVEILRLLLTRQITNLIRHGGAGPEASVSKIFYSELLMRLMRFGAELEGLPTAVDRMAVQGSGWESGWFMRDFLNAYSWTIGGGTNEIMRNIVGEQVLGLGREPRPEGAKQ